MPLFRAAPILRSARRIVNVRLRDASEKPSDVDRREFVLSFACLIDTKAGDRHNRLGLPAGPPGSHRPLARKERLMANEVVLTDANFNDEVKNTKGLVLVDFYADWCMPCRMLAPTIEKIAEEYVGRVKVGKLNVDANFATASQFSVSGIPTIMLFKDGAMAERLVGLQTLDVLKGVINKHIS